MKEEYLDIPKHLSNERNSNTRKDKYEKQRIDRNRKVAGYIGSLIAVTASMFVFSRLPDNDNNFRTEDTTISLAVTCPESSNFIYSEPRSVGDDSFETGVVCSFGETVITPVNQKEPLSNNVDGVIEFKIADKVGQAKAENGDIVSYGSQATVRITNLPNYVKIRFQDADEVKSTAINQL